MSELMPKNNALQAQLIPELDQLSVVDKLQLLKPLREYMEYAVDVKQNFDHPDYKFQIDNIPNLLETESELIGRTFLLPEFNILTQVKCTVNFDSFTISVVFLNPEMKDKAVEWRGTPTFTIRIAQNPDEQSKGTLFPHSFEYGAIIVYGQFYEICELSYKTHMENDAGFSENSITLHLFVEKTSLHLPKDICVEDDVFLWKVDVSALNLEETIKEMTVVGLSPYFCSDPEDVKVQILLYFVDKEFKAEIRFLNEFEFKHEECDVRVHVMYLAKSRWQSNISSNSLKFTETFGKRYSLRTKLGYKSQLLLPSFVFNNKLFVKVTLTYT